ncbi:MAG: Rrf2 family transcriptional regulator [Candidatus Solibacter usitatus]|nr:Rrf2 family transcriptional regulator [Candidatus Solibacter usitatus]
MNISVKADYALHAILDLSLQPFGEPVRIADIAGRQKIPQKFLELILSSLKQGGFVLSKRGADGGYLLARTADTITVGEVLRFVDGGKARDAALRRNSNTPFSDMWRRVDDAVSSVMDQTTFAELGQRWKEKSGTYIPNWDI